MATESDENSVAPGEDPRKSDTPAELVRRIKLSLQGLQYDLHHWSQLPPVQEQQSTLRCVQYVVGRNQRGPYLTIFFVFILLLLCVSVAVRSGRRRA